MTGAERGQLRFCLLLWWGLAQGTPEKCVYFGESMGAGMRGSLSQPDHQAALQEAVQAQRLRATHRFRTKRLRKKPTGHCLGVLYLGPCPRTNFGQGQGKAGICREPRVSGEGPLPRADRRQPLCSSPESPCSPTVPMSFSSH